MKAEEFDGQDRREKARQALDELRKRAEAAESISTTLLSIVSEMVASIESPYPTTQKRWAAALLQLLNMHPAVHVDANLRARLERMRDTR
jgi:hypothetical protein